MANLSHSQLPSLPTDIDLLSLDDFKELVKSSQELSKELSLESLLDNILIMAGKLTESPETSVILSHPNQSGLYFAAATGEESEWILSNFGQFAEKQIPVDGSKAGSVFKTGESIVENVVKDHFLNVDTETESITKSMVCVPLSAGKGEARWVKSWE